MKNLRQLYVLFDLRDHFKIEPLNPWHPFEFTFLKFELKWVANSMFKSI